MNTRTSLKFIILKIESESTKDLVKSLKEVTKQFNSPKLKRKEKISLIPMAESIRRELSRRGRTVSVNELADPDEGDSFVNSDME